MKDAKLVDSLPISRSSKRNRKKSAKDIITKEVLPVIDEDANSDEESENEIDFGAIVCMYLTEKRIKSIKNE